MRTCLFLLGRHGGPLVTQDLGNLDKHHLGIGLFDGGPALHGVQHVPAEREIMSVSRERDRGTLNTRSGNSDGI